jgi:ankyrin repeat protein
MRRVGVRLVAVVSLWVWLASPLFANHKAKKKIYQSDVPLISAIAKGDLDAARQLVRSGAALNVVDEGNYTPLQFAIYDGYTDFARDLLTAGADPNFANKQGRTPLMMAAWSNDLDIAKILLSKRVKVNAIDDDGETALMAALHNCPDGMPFSLDGPADDELQPKIDAHQNCSDGAMVQLLLDAGADPNVKSKTGVTALLIAAIMGNKCGVVDLIRLGANPSAKDRFDRTPETESCGIDDGNRAQICDLVKKAKVNPIATMESLQRKPDQKCDECCAETVKTEAIGQ